MKLVFFHGWAFDASFWDDLCALLPNHPQHRVDRGYFGNQIKYEGNGSDAILIGHSLGFVHGMMMNKNWAGRIAINSFPNFVKTNAATGCVTPAILRTMRQQLKHDTQRTLMDFYRLIGSNPPNLPHNPDIDNLCFGLDELANANIGDLLRNRPSPTLILAAQNDPLVPMATSEAFAIAGAHIEWHPSGGHALPQSDAPWCADAIKKFIKVNFGDRA